MEKLREVTIVNILIKYFKKLLFIIISLAVVYILLLVNILAMIAVIKKFNIVIKPGTIPLASLSFILAILEFFGLYKIFKKK